MVKTKNTKIKLSFNVEPYLNQFKGLKTDDPSRWPPLPKASLLVFIALVVYGLLVYLWVAPTSTQLSMAAAQEDQLKQDFLDKLAKAGNLTELKQRRQHVFEQVTMLEKQLPGRSEIDALLSEINQAGLNHRLQFELFRPAPMGLTDYYAELPIAIRVTGRFDDVGLFAQDLAQLPRVVTLHNLNVVPTTHGQVAMDALVKTYRYLDAEEQQARKTPSKGAPR